ncbi:unnamed protein product [Allacma fusca]|uniref:Lipase domain-containing protein n=1 Tax=Allacma fusca TaxID=39272 RepID=A0A8J2KQJ3_9HEXA|nr:unnamed protein product [Allacma fusca]
MNCNILFCLTPVILICLLSCIECRNIFFPRRFVYRQYPQRLFQIRHDPAQAKPRKLVTRNNMFGWLNLKNYVRFHLWSRKNPDLAHEIHVNDVESLRTSSFNSKRLTKIIIHGYQDNANEVNVGDWIIFMKDAYLSFGDVNVIAVDYSFFATTPFYLVPMHELVGEKLKDLLEFLIQRTDLDLNSVHLIGWSWGSHVASMAAKPFKGKVGRITGLDPAGPTFKFVGREFRLDKNDAKFVDVIHTSAGTRLFWGGHFGLRDAIGHVDIYPNGGEKQTGCPMEHTFNVESKFIRIHYTIFKYSVFTC